MKKICFRITLTLTVLTMTEHVAARPHAAQGTLLWQPTVTASGAGFTNSVAVDNQGNVVAAGYTGNTGGVLDFTVAKFDRDGTLSFTPSINRGTLKLMSRPAGQSVRRIYVSTCA